MYDLYLPPTFFTPTSICTRHRPPVSTPANFTCTLYTVHSVFCTSYQLSNMFHANKFKMPEASDMLASEICSTWNYICAGTDTKDYNDNVPACNHNHHSLDSQAATTSCATMARNHGSTSAKIGTCHMSTCLLSAFAVLLHKLGVLFEHTLNLNID